MFVTSLEHFAGRVLGLYFRLLVHLLQHLARPRDVVVLPWKKVSSGQDAQVRPTDRPVQ